LREHRNHAGNRCGADHVDRSNQSMWLMRSANGQVCLSLEMHVTCESTPARDQLFVLDAPDPAADGTAMGRVHKVSGLRVGWRGWIGD